MFFRRFYGAQRVPMSSKWGNKNFYKGKLFLFINSRKANWLDGELGSIWKLSS